MNAAAGTPAIRRGCRRPRRSAHTVVAALLAACAGGLTGGCGGPGTAAIPAYTQGFAALCASSPTAIFPNAASYYGAAPHPVVLFVSYNQEELANIPELGSSELDVLPWTSGPPADDQLVLCANRVSSSSRAAHACTYQQQSQTVLAQPTGPALHLKMYRASYQVSLREIQNGSTIATARLAGADTTCPSSVGEAAIINKSVYSWPTSQQWQRAFGRYLTGRAR
jgi:hypothetical protein